MFNDIAKAVVPVVVPVVKTAAIETAKAAAGFAAGIAIGAAICASMETVKHGMTKAQKGVRKLRSMRITFAPEAA